MCFGSRTNPEIHAGTSDYADQQSHYPNKPVKASGWLSNTPGARSRAMIKAKSKEELQRARKKWVHSLLSYQSYLITCTCLWGNLLLIEAKTWADGVILSGGYYRGGIAYGNFYGNGFNAWDEEAVLW
jgi:hypothetical protein